MTKKLVGLFASVALLGSGLALAGDQERSKDTQAQSSQPVGGDATGGAGTQGQSGSQQGQVGVGSQGQTGVGTHGQMGVGSEQMGEKQITGTVVKSSANLLSLRTDNGIIAIKVDKSTKFQDPAVKRARDLKEGQQVRASFDIQGSDNVAKSISLDTNMGGSGLGTDQGINQQPGNLGDDMGGSGLDQGIDKDHNLGGDVGGSGDVGGTSGDVSGSGDQGGSGDIK